MAGSIHRLLTSPVLPVSLSDSRPNNGQKCLCRFTTSSCVLGPSRLHIVISRKNSFIESRRLFATKRKLPPPPIPHVHRHQRKTVTMVTCFKAPQTRDVKPLPRVTSHLYHWKNKYVAHLSAYLVISWSARGKAYALGHTLGILFATRGRQTELQHSHSQSHGSPGAPKVRPHSSIGL